MSGDPRHVPEATVIDEISYNEAMELAYFGARVIHPQTMAPAISREIPIRIRSAFSPGHPGSRIIASPAGVESVVKGISGIDGVALVNLEGAGMIGVPGTADRLFGALRNAGVSVMLISQGSSEHSHLFCGSGSIRRPGEDRGRRSLRPGTDPGAGPESGDYQGMRCPGGGRRRYGRDPRCCRSILRDPGQGRHQRPGYRPGRLRTKHFGGDLSGRYDACATNGACELLPFGKDRLHRPDRAGFGRQRPAGPDGG